METRAPYVAVGVFVVLLIAGLLIAVLWFAQVQFREQVTYYDIFFQGSVTGLTVGSTVRDNGIPVGRVAEVRLDPSDPSRVRVMVELQGDIAVKTDTVAALELQGLAGGVYVNLVGSTRDAPDLERKEGERYPVIASRQSGLEQLVNAAPELLSRAIALTDQLRQVLSTENIQAISASIANFRKLSDVAAGHSDEIGAAIDSGAQSLEGLRSTLNSANGILAGLSKLVAPEGGVPATVQQIDEAAHGFAELAQHLDALVAENRPQIDELTHHSVPEFEQLVHQTEALEQQLSRLADEIERDPSRFLYGNRREGYRPQ
jgi:phospholipid/cholesterol/gamma-HCH transport system substrate-binding protein